MNIRIYTDGSCSGNPGRGGYACIVDFEKFNYIIQNHATHTTNNEMELLAVVKAIECCNEFAVNNSNIKIFCDSAYIVNSINQKWLENWQANGWITRDGNTVKHRYAWVKVKLLLNKLKQRNISVELIKVPGHSGVPLNEAVDKLAKEARDRQLELTKRVSKQNEVRHANM